MTDQISRGPNGQPMLSLAACDKIKMGEDQQAQVYLNLLHDAADRTGDREKIKDDIAPAWKSPEIVESDPAWFPSEDI